MKTWRVVILTIGVLFFIVVVLFAGSATAAPAAGSIFITTLADEFNTSGEGTGCALREGVQAINTVEPFGGCPGGQSYDTIMLQLGQVYVLSIPGNNEDNNVTGDLDIKRGINIVADTQYSTPSPDGQNNAEIVAVDTFDDRLVQTHQGKTKLESITLANAPAALSMIPLAELEADRLHLRNIAFGLDLPTNSITHLKGFRAEKVPNAIYCDGKLSLSQAEMTHAVIFAFTSCDSELQDVLMVGPQTTYSAITNYGKLTFKSGTIKGFEAQSGAGINNYGRLYVYNSRFENNTAKGFSGSAGGALSFSNGSLGEIYTSAFWRNTAEYGGGVDISGGSVGFTKNLFVGNKAVQGGAIHVTTSSIVNIVNTTISDNEAKGDGGGIANNGTVSINNVTITRNRADTDNSSGGGGGGIANGFGTFIVSNSIIEDNTDPTLYMFNSSPDCLTGSAVFTTQGNNLIGTNDGCPEFASGVNGDKAGTNATPLDAKLDTLKDNGGQTETHALLNSSPAVDAGKNATCEETDQRSAPRPNELVCDMGAYEKDAAVPADTPTPTKTFTPTHTNTPKTAATLTHTPTKTHTPEFTRTTESCTEGPGFFSILKPKDGKKIKKRGIKIDWTDSECAKKYKVQVREESPQGEVVYKEKVTETEFKTGKLERGMTYALRVVAINKEGKFSSDWQTFEIAEK